MPTDETWFSRIVLRRKRFGRYAPSVVEITDEAWVLGLEINVYPERYYGRGRFSQRVHLSGAKTLVDEFRDRCLAKGWAKEDPYQQKIDNELNPEKV